MRFTVQHTEAQKTDLRKFFTQYGQSLEGIGQFMQRNDSHLSAVLYRGCRYAGPARVRKMIAVATAPMAMAGPGRGARQTNRGLDRRGPLPRQDEDAGSIPA